MDKLTILANHMGKRVSELLKQTDKYKQYQEARAAIKADRNLEKKVNLFMEKHTQFLYEMRDGTATFDRERYMSQEFHKLMLNKNVNTYIENGLCLIETLAEFYTKSVEDLDIDLDI